MIRSCYQHLVPEATRARFARLRRYLSAEEFDRARLVGGLPFALCQWSAAVCQCPRTLSVAAGGTRLHVRPGTSDIRTLEETFHRNQYALPLTFTPTTIIDAGANIGIAALYFILRWPNASIAALEPEKSNFSLLQRNVRHIPAVRPLPLALWTEEARLQLEDPSADKWGFRMKPSTETATSVRGVDIPTLLDELAWPQVDLLKIDIEGAERELFADGAPWLTRVRAWVLEVHESIAPGAEAAVARAASLHGFQGERIADCIWFKRPTD